MASIAASINADLNNVTVATSSQNLIGQSCPEELVLIGDVFYDDEIAGEVVPWCERLRKSGCEILVGDPGRHPLTPDRLALLEKLKSYQLPENVCIENHGFKFVNVWRFK